MQDLLPPAPSLLAFLLAALLLAVTPGPGVVYIVTRTLAQGRACGLASVAGVALGNFGNAAAAALGLAALLAAAPLAFDLLRYAGAAYLVWLGVQALRAGPPAGAAAPAAVPRRRQVFGQGVAVALLNPKTMLFFAAFLPLFMGPTPAPAMQALVLGGLFVAIAALTDGAYVLLAAAVAPALQSAGGAARHGRLAAAVVYIALGVWAACSGARAPRP